MKKIFIIATLLTGISALAQNKNLNQTVQVVNTYENHIDDVERTFSKLPVPDSLTRFNLNFDYSGFDTPYRGNSEFNPFFTELEMDERPFSGKKLYLKAGAGYGLAPELDFAYTVKDRGRFKMGTHAVADGYYGAYRPIFAQGVDLTPVSKSRWMGYESKIVAGLDARADWNNVILTSMVDYEGVFADGSPCGVQTSRMYNGVSAKLGLDSNYDPQFGWKYKIDAEYDFGYEKLIGYGYSQPVLKPAASVEPERSTAFEHNPKLRFYMRYNFRNGSVIDVEAKGNVTFNIPRRSELNHMGFSAIVNPRYFFTNEKVFFGIGLGLLVDGGQNFVKCSGHLPLAFWPTLDFHWTALRGRLDLYANADLDGSMYGMRASAMDYRFYIPVADVYGDPASAHKLLNPYANMRTFNAKAGLRGNFGDCFDYDLHVGYKGVKNNPLFYVGKATDGYSVNLYQIYEDTNDLFAAVSFKGVFGGFTIEGKAGYDYYMGADKLLSVPSNAYAGLDMSYLVLNRISFGVGADWKTGYRAGDYYTPYILDLHAFADYKVTNMLTVYLKGGNLLNRSAQYIPLYARKGICVTGGVVLNF